MDVQTLFYTVGTIFLIICIVMLLGIAYLLFQIKKIIEEVSLTATVVRNRIESVKSVSSLGTIVRWGVGKIISKIRNRNNSA